MSETQQKALTESMRQVRSATSELALQLKRANEAARQARRSAQACVGGNCVASSSHGAAAAGGSGSRGGGSASLLSASGARALLQGDWRSAISGMLSSLSRTLTSQLARSMGGGIGGNLIGSLAGGALSLLIGRLFRKRQQVTVDNTVRAEVLNFPRMTSLDLASNPASRLFSGRAVARGPAFTVQVDYRGGAEDIVTAKVASRLADINFAQGIR